MFCDMILLLGFITFRVSYLQCVNRATVYIQLYVFTTFKVCNIFT